MPTSQSNENLRREKRKADNLERNTGRTTTNKETSLPKKAKINKKNSDKKNKNSSKNDSKDSLSQRSEENKGNDGETGPKKPQKYKCTCECDKKILNWILEDMEVKSTITMAKALFTWGTFWLFLGWKFCPKHLSYFADHMCLVEINEMERLKRLKAIWHHRDPHLLTRFVMKHLEWFESKEKLWLYGDKQGLDMDMVTKK